MTPTDFKDFFISSSSSIQQEIVSSLASRSINIIGGKLKPSIIE